MTMTMNPRHGSISTNNTNTSSTRCSILPRPKHQFLILAAIYVCCSLGVVHKTSFLFSIAGVSRWMQLAEEDAHNYEHLSAQEKQRIRNQEDEQWIKATSDLAQQNKRTSLPHIDSVAKATTGGIISQSAAKSHLLFDGGGDKTAADVIVQNNIQRVASVRRKWRIQWERNRDENLKTLAKWDDNPVFVLSLPGTSTLATSRYFKCGLGKSGADDFAFYWTPTNDGNEQQQEIGRCLQTNLQNANPPLEGCGKAKVWSSVGYVAPMDEQCFYPSLDRNAMEAIAAAYPEATILQVTQDPVEWYKSSYRRFRSNLVSYCGRNNDNSEDVPIPPKNGSKEQWVAFYEWNLQSVRDFAAAHPSIHYVEVALEDPTTDAILQRELGLPRLCWPEHKQVKPTTATTTASAEPPRALQSTDTESTPSATATQKTRAQQLRYPIFVTSLPKSGTTSTQRFFQCGLSYNQAAHHWTHNETADIPIKIGKCMEYNQRHNRSIFEDCGADFKVWTDTGYMDEPPPSADQKRRRKRKQKQGKQQQQQSSEQELGCYFPTLHGGLEHFYRSHPNGTILNVVRDADAWYESAMNWRKLPERMAKRCQGFPPPDSSAEDWKQFYVWHTNHVRKFAKKHPSLVYLEVSLEAADTGKILQDHTGIPDFCWGNCNPNPANGMCGVLGKMRRHKLEQQEQKKKEAFAAVIKKNVKRGFRFDKKRQASLRKKNTDDGGAASTGRTKDEWSAIEKAFDMLKNFPIEDTSP